MIGPGPVIAAMSAPMPYAERRGKDDERRAQQASAVDRRRGAAGIAQAAAHGGSTDGNRCGGSCSKRQGMRAAQCVPALAEIPMAGAKISSRKRGLVFARAIGGEFLGLRHVARSGAIDKIDPELRRRSKWPIDAVDVGRPAPRKSRATGLTRYCPPATGRCRIPAAGCGQAQRMILLSSYGTDVGGRCERCSAVAPIARKDPALHRHM